MVRECVALSMLAAVCPGCSLILDFDTALPADAAIDAVYTKTECDYLEPNDSITGAVDVTAADHGPAAICMPASGAAEDHDYYRFIATGATVTISIVFTGRPGGDLDLKLYSGDGTMVGQSRGFGDNEMLVCPGAAPLCPMLTAGPHVIEVMPGVAGSVNNYSFTISQ